MILPRQTPPVSHVSLCLRVRPAARPVGYAVGRSFGCCSRLAWTPAGLQCEGRIIHGTVYEVAATRKQERNP